MVLLDGVGGKKTNSGGWRSKQLAVMGGIMFYCSSLHCLLSKPYPGHEWELALTRAAERGEPDDPELIKVTLSFSDFGHLEQNCGFSRHKNDLGSLYLGTIIAAIQCYLFLKVQYSRRKCWCIMDCRCSSKYRSTTMTGGLDVWWRRAVRWASSPARSNWRTPVSCRSRGWDRTDSAPGNHERLSAFTVSASQTTTPFYKTGQTWVTLHPPGNVKLPQID